MIANGSADCTNVGMSCRLEYGAFLYTMLNFLVVL